jgi:uncharacterized pyridoxal phosphate-containing UPF0001 family protein
LDVLVQVSLDDPARAGRASQYPPSPGDRLLRSAAAAGVMAIAPLDWDPEPAFARLADDPRDCVRTPDATIVSAGMSGDLRPAMPRARHMCVSAAILGTVHR